jgi:hypothetical protein
LQSITVSSVTPGSETPGITPANLDDKGNVTPPEGSGGEPTLILGKFKSQEDLANAYTELEKKLSQKPAEPKAPEAPKPGDLSTTDGARATLKEKGLDFDKYSKEFAEKGELSDESYSELLTKGISMSQVRGFIEGQKALAEQSTSSIYEHVGGKESFDALFEFAKTALTPSEQAAYNKAAQAGDLDSVKLMLTGLQARYNEEMGVTPNLTTNVTKAGDSMDVFNSLDEYYTQVGDPQYRTNKAFRDKLDAKLERSAKKLGLI